MKIKHAIVIRFKQICSERNLKYNEVATISGVTPSTVYSMLDDNRKDLSIITLKKLCDGLEIDLKDFFNHKIFDEIAQEIE